MGIRDFIDPKEYNKHSPAIDTVVTGENCFYYISLLKRFYELRKDMTNDQYNTFLHAAAWRYTEFLFNTRPDAFTSTMPVPLDIAYVWHAHMLSPFHYYDDIASHGSTACAINPQFALPLKAMYDHHLADPKKKGSQPNSLASGNTGAHPEPPDVVSATMYPFELTLEEIADQTARERNQNYLTCPLCKTRLYHTWEEAALWRSDPNVVIQCNYKPDKHHSYTLDTYLVNHVLSLLRNGFRGPLLDPNGKEKSDKAQKEYTAMSKKLYETLDPKKFRLVRDPNALYQVLISNGAELDAKERTANEKYKTFAEELVHLLRTRYDGNPTPAFSLDLIQAVRRLDDFVESIAETPILSQPESIAYSIHRYYEFLHVYKTSKTPAVPNLDIDIVWHVHMLHPETYRKSMLEFMQKVPSHDTIISPLALDLHVEETRRAWRNFRRNQHQSPADHEKEMENKKSSLLTLKTKPKLVFNATKNEPTLKYTSASFRPVASYQSSRQNNQEGSIMDLGSETSAISYHNWQSTRQYVPSSIPRDTLKKALDIDKEQEQILEHAKSATGYGYIGTITQGVIRQEKIRKRIADGYAPEYPINLWPLQKYTGRILPCQSIFGVEDYYITRTKYKFWSSPRGGLMYRAYNDSCGQYGWTTNGYDWYSEEECQFTPNEPGEFDGTEFLGLARKVVVGHMALRREQEYIYDVAPLRRLVPAPPPHGREVLFSQRSSTYNSSRSSSSYQPSSLS